MGDQLQAVFVDTGLLRKGEPQRVVTTFQEHLEVQLHPVQAVESFFDDLQGITDPEQKRVRIGNRFNPHF